MGIGIRGTTPITATSATSTVAVTLTGARQPQTNDVLAIVHHNDFYALSAMNTPTVGGSSTGVTSIVNADAGSNNAHTKAWYFVVTSGGSDLTVSETEGAPGDEEKALAVWVLSGVDTANPVADSDQAFSATGVSSHVLPSVDAATADDWLICGLNTGTGAAADHYDPPASPYVEDYDAVHAGAMNYTGGHEPLTAAGATGSRTFVLRDGANNPSAQPWSGVIICFRAAAAGAATDPGLMWMATPPGRIPPIRLWTPGPPGVALSYDSGLAPAGQAATAATEADQRSATSATAVPGRSGSATASARPVTQATGARIQPTGTGTAPQRTTTAGTTVKGGLGAGRASARATTSSTGVKGGVAAAQPVQRSSDAATSGGKGATAATTVGQRAVATSITLTQPGLAVTHNRTTATGVHGGTGVGLAAQHTATASTGRKGTTAATLTVQHMATVDSGQKNTTGAARTVQHTHTASPVPPPPVTTQIGVEGYTTSVSVDGLTASTGAVDGLAAGSGRQA